ncbi:MAG: ECF transporter S component [Firmicutes bacterium]|nr:ECF transporter S component [Bacillota bacterium]
MSKTKQIVYSGFFIALGIIIPIVFHFVNNFGKMFLPMHIPVLLSGFILGPYFGLLVGILTPFISSVLTGMPPLFPMALIMVFELGTYGLVSGFLYNKLKQNEIISLVSAMVCGRIVSALVVFSLIKTVGIKFPSPTIYIKAATITGIPGILIQIIIIPTIIYVLNKNKFIERGNSLETKRIF